MSKEELFISRLKKTQRVVGNSSFDIGDDAIFIRLSSKLVSVTSDNCIQDIHFKLNAGLRLIAHKAIKRSVTDTYAVGAKPLFLVTNAIIPSTFNRKHIVSLSTGIKHWAKYYKLRIIGGDTSFHNGPLSISTTILGELIKNPLGRNGAKIGDSIYVTGKLGGSVKSSHLTRKVSTKYLHKLISKYNLTSMIDITDGFIIDMSRITTRYGKGAIIFENDIPLNPGASINSAYYDGEDYEFIFTSTDQNIPRNLAYPIGQVTRMKIILGIDKHGKTRKIPVHGWEYK